MGDLILTTFDWVPPPPRGFVRDLRIRWALEEAGLPYTVATVPFVPFDERKPEHLAHQPFGQVPWLTDGDLSVFESGAILLHLGQLSDKLLPTDAHARNQATEWVFGALSSVEMAVVPWTLLAFANQLGTPAAEPFENFVTLRLRRMERVLGDRTWLAGVQFSIADILMADVLRVVDRFDGLAKFPACRAYVTRATARPPFEKAHKDQLAHFAAGDAARA